MAELKKDILVRMYPKNSLGAINIDGNLFHSEYRCRCSNIECNITLASAVMLYAWDNSRRSWGGPLSINSGYRCIMHNKTKEVGGVSDSNHTRGQAVDISTTGMSGSDIEKLFLILSVYFDFAKLYDNFIHAQVDD